MNGVFHAEPNGRSALHEKSKIQAKNNQKYVIYFVSLIEVRNLNMKATDINTTLIYNYFSFLKNLSPDNKLELIARLSKSMKSSKSQKEKFHLVHCMDLGILNIQPMNSLMN
ncbi:hypothetical protein DIT68_08130 [Brumimicrobium oceani]|uniref:Uncharacterized protein n=1 Tax=Brumimicrobium oceani TaxID=2100725 RepID=A0A2U2XCW0_9FLAO|nr:hypothetical protein DIT68_08130 [Brumimicrobium oceani]